MARHRLSALPPPRHPGRHRARRVVGVLLRAHAVPLAGHRGILRGRRLRDSRGGRATRVAAPRAGRRGRGRRHGPRGRRPGAATARAVLRRLHLRTRGAGQAHADLVRDARDGHGGRLLLSPPEPWTLYYTVLGLAGLAVVTALLLRRSRWGYALVGIGEDEERALTLGIDTTRVKVGTFALSAAFMGAVGAAMAPRWTYLDPQVFNPLVSFQTVIMALVGAATTA